jgi:hypothetical protein
VHWQLGKGGLLSGEHLKSCQDIAGSGLIAVCSEGFI